MTKLKSSSLQFFQQFLTNPGAVGAISPSSQKLAMQMVDWIDWADVDAVAECGPGTGVFTERIISKMETNARFFGVELNPELHDAVQSRFVDYRFYNDSVENIEAMCTQEGIEKIDALVCSLPWASFSEELQDSCLDAMLRVLRTDGQFVTFAYLQGLALPAGRRFKKHLHETFSSVELSEVVWMNLPPAIVYRCHR